MAIKVITESTNESKPFPKLMIATKRGGIDEGIIVLFEYEGTGTVIRSVKGSDKRIGDRSIHFGMDCFEDYNLPVTLQNE